MNNRFDKFIYWTPRILSIFFILFLSMFSLDVLSMSTNVWDIIIGLLQHNIPSFIMLMVLIVSWRFEIVGGVGFVGAGLLYLALLVINGMPWYIVISWGTTLSGPAFVIGGLFFMCWKKRLDLGRKNKEV